ncbi:26090_t:CDS:2 [Dentiscutata erythropus]|uniref:26090_t:CDS:1 n=1 Tax=Dentiscutata erythropus TaxID=1348616 RepID=A0A9N9EFU9_9GLOM|nr:26090_t:CDS:2 [Dentiscutata erythropus]
MGCITSKLSEKSDSIKSQSSQMEFQYIDGRRYPNAQDIVYPLPNDEEESDRLHLQHFLARYIWNSNFSAPVRGHLIWQLREYPLIEVVELDVSPYQTKQIKPKNFTFVKANATEGLPFDDNTFDFIFQRYLTAAVPKEKWPYLINELVRVLKPGGFLELSEFSSLFDTGPVNQRLWYTAVRVLEEKGVDFSTYQKLEEYAQNQGQLENIKKEDKLYCHGLKSNDIKLSKVAINNTMTLYTSLKQVLTKPLNVSEDEYDELVKASKDELFEFDTYYHLVRVYARKINNI